MFRKDLLDRAKMSSAQKTSPIEHQLALTKLQYI